jgi:outer membrane protein assembly factor BamB
MNPGGLIRLYYAWLPALVLLVAGTSEAADWPQWRGPNRDGAWNETGILEAIPPEGLKFAWRVPVGSGFSSPVVAKGRVYVTDVESKRPSAWERVLCVDAKSARMLWVHRYPVDYPEWAFEPGQGGPRATPAIRNGRVYTLGALGHLFCLDAATGRVVWERNLAKDYGVKEFTGITGSPLIEDGLLILNICAKPAACVVAFNKDTGKEAWKALDDTFTYSTPIILTEGGKKQLIVWTQEAVTSLNPKTGETWWREVIRTPGDMAVSTPVFSNHRLLIAGLMMKLDREKPAAEILWPESAAPTKRVLSNTSTALVRGEYLYSAKISGELVCLEAGTGKQVWQTNTVTILKNGSSVHLTPCGDAVFLFTDQGNLIRAQLTPQGYREIGRAHLLDPTSPFGDRKCTWAPPAYADRHVFVRNDTELVCASLAAKLGK